MIIQWYVVTMVASIWFGLVGSWRPADFPRGSIGLDWVGGLVRWFELAGGPAALKLGT